MAGAVANFSKKNLGNLAKISRNRRSLQISPPTNRAQNDVPRREKNREIRAWARVCLVWALLQGRFEFDEGPSGTRNFDTKIDEF